MLGITSFPGFIQKGGLDETQDLFLFGRELIYDSGDLFFGQARQLA